jgi:hypothetical protein
VSFLVPSSYLVPKQVKRGFVGENCPTPIIMHMGLCPRYPRFNVPCRKQCCTKRHRTLIPFFHMSPYCNIWNRSVLGFFDLYGKLSQRNGRISLAPLYVKRFM